MDRGVAHPIQVFFSGFRPVWGQPVFRDPRFIMGINISKLATKADFQARISTPELLIGNCMDTLFDISLYCLRDFLTARIRIKHPLASCRHEHLASKQLKEIIRSQFWDQSAGQFFQLS